ncbi:hypothetical protein [Methylobacterium planeticum]|uniref:Uncharacterized protein n=1 Tax=Methylobacterium planeticum TaxID=2615211 RepID=A0A6N6MMQ9_9HYPH|nr:hypothetical protein [Methylobacterium planeticum]KAB1071161.1 hypothetical protein F6X51_19875 [Methylobacterium planeticum]
MRTKLTTLSEAERIAHARDLGRDRKRAERERARDAGRPDPATVDRAIVEAVRSFFSADPQSVRPIAPDALLRVAALQLLRRAHAAHDAGAEPIHYTREAVSEALYARLSASARGGPKAQKAA